ncbi:M28 family peptidase [Psychroserpens ponticola]|uniref:M28 family peptidase n=1 Tax=Psychroserpens ponticola TaxID=2932268 RepID=A0ABY7S0D3_9FLAO|nr:M28 family peptidase [Psychroserpens ponticola]WCO02843.1 M28 family peptidase [Psychroserpens ponticola]
MKKNLLHGILCLLAMSCAKEPADPTKYGNTITSDDLKVLLYKFASDDFEGRETGEPGHDMATDYLKEKYISMEVASPYENGQYLQEVPLERQKLPEANITVNGKKATIYDDFIPSKGVNVQSLKVNQIAYAGYGIDAENYSDYKNLDVKGKIVVIKSGEPLNTDSTYVTTGTKEKSQWTSGRRARNLKIESAKNRGAKAVFVLNAPTHSYFSKRYAKMVDTEYEGSIRSVGHEDDISDFIISKAFAKQIVNDIDTNHTPKIIDIEIELSIKKNFETFNSNNVVAFIKGDKKPDEIIVISAHLDHLGIEDGEISNGADDDGSGTVAMLEIAQAFKAAIKDGYSPKRSILFLHLTAEEKGLQGSKYYTDVNPIFPLENTVANLNIDMIGRVDKLHEEDRNYVYVIGSDMLSTELFKISENANQTYTNINLDYRYSNKTDPNRYYYRSDHYNFAKHNIPIAFYFNGKHEDYHRATDTPDKIQYDLLENRTRLVFYTAWELVNRKDRIIVDKAETIE